MGAAMDDPFDLPPDVLRRIPLFAEISKVLSWTGGPVNWDLARQLAMSIAAGDAPPRPVDGTDHAEVADHVRIAELWLEEVTGLPAPSHLVRARAATSVDWAEHATTAFSELVDPIAGKIVRAIAEQSTTLSEENPIAQALGQMAPMFIGIQVGTILGSLAREVTGTHDVGLPANDDQLLLVLHAIDEVATDYQLDRRQVRQWVALRAAAQRMAYEGFPWMRMHFLSLYHNYVASLDVDLAAGMQRLRELDLSDPARIQEALSDEGLFAPQPSSQTAVAADRVTRFLSVVEAHTRIAAEQAGVRAGDTARIGEAFTRLVADEGRGARMLAEFIGLDLASDRKMGRAFVTEVLEERGWEGLNRAWQEPDGFPAHEEIADPRAWLTRTAP